MSAPRPSRRLNIAAGVIAICGGPAIALGLGMGLHWLAVLLGAPS